MLERLLGYITSVFRTDICLDVKCSRTYIVDYVRMALSMWGGKAVVGPAQCVMKLRTSFCNTSLTIPVRVPGQQHITLEYQTTSPCGVFFISTDFILTISRKCKIFSRETIFHV
jgi:hypothetical protein